MLKDYQPRPESGKHSFGANCAPGQTSFHSTTFSCGIFQWLPKANGKGLKKSAVIHRVIGSYSFPQQVYEEARRLCQKMDAGWVPSKKSSRIK